jgi:hypothetical protein
MDVIVMTLRYANRVKAGLIRADSVVQFARRDGHRRSQGATKPEISTKEKLRALLAAKAVGIQDPDPAHHSGVIVHQILSDLGVLDEVTKRRSSLPIRPRRSSRAKPISASGRYPN